MTSFFKIWSRSSEEEDFEKFSINFHCSYWTPIPSRMECYSFEQTLLSFILYCPSSVLRLVENGKVLAKFFLIMYNEKRHLNKLKPCVTWQVWLKFTEWFCRGWVVKVVNVFALFWYDLLKTSMVFQYTKFNSPSAFTQGCFVPSLVKKLVRWLQTQLDPFQ